jgi:uncharacterized membrane protein YccF (DUF307 family)
MITLITKDDGTLVGVGSVNAFIGSCFAESSWQIASFRLVPFAESLFIKHANVLELLLSCR